MKSKVSKCENKTDDIQTAKGNYRQFESFRHLKRNPAKSSILEGVYITCPIRRLKETYCNLKVSDILKITQQNQAFQK
jgi:hypothetical protein